MVNYYLGLLDKFMNTPEMLLSPMDKLQIVFAFILPIALIYFIYRVIAELLEDYFRRRK